MCFDYQSFRARYCLRLAVSLVASLLAAYKARDAAAQANAGAPQMVTLSEAIARAQKSEPAFAATRAEAGALALDRSIARAGLLPSVLYHNQYIYTQPGSTGSTITSSGAQVPPVVFIANNAVHEYVSQASINETVGLRQFADVQLASANAARAAAELEIARRGLVAAVVGLYFGLAASEHKVHVAERAASESSSFTDLTAKREAAREVAHADVVKAQLLQQQRQRDLADARLAADKARLELGVLLFPDPRTPYVTEPSAPPALASRADVEASAAAHNAELKSALAALRAGDAAVLGARAAYLPDVGLNFSYGIDAAQFAVNGPGGFNNLGYSAVATVDIPVWDWLATEHRVKQSVIRRDAARVALTAAQRRVIAALDETYAEAAEAQRQAASLELSVQTAAESLRLTKLRYAAGEATALEVVDSQTALTGAENAREDGVVRYETGLANLQTLTGTL